jgi:LuxR family maltose regulon positive regulatory protein
VAQDFAVVLDDVHLIRDKAVCELLSLMLRHPLRSMQLILVGRRDPLLPIAALRARGLIAEFRIRDLRFTVDEATQLLRSAIGSPIEKAITEALVRKSEGWVTGLRLAILAMHGQKDPGRELLELKGTTRYVVDYLISEVLNHQPPDIRNFLLVTSIFDRFCAPLYDTLRKEDKALTGTEVDGIDFMDWLLEHNLFVIGLDMENRWYRYHHLFQDCLKRQLNRSFCAKTIAAFHSRASRWFESQGLISESIKHALKSGDVASAAKIVERYRGSQLDEDRWYDVEQWLKLLPMEIKQRTGLLIAQAWTALHRFQVGEIPPLLTKAAALIEDGDPLERELHALWSSVHFWAGDGKRSLQSGQMALVRSTGEAKLVDGHIEMHIGLARCMTGNADMAIRGLEDRISAARPQSDIYLARLVAGLVFVSQIAGNLNRVKIEARRLRSVATRRSMAYTKAIGFYMEAWAHLHACKLDQALHLFTAASRQPHILHTRVAIDALAGLALTLQLMRRFEGAAEAVRRMQDFALETGLPACLTVARSCEARLALMGGDLDTALTWAQAVSDEPVASELFIWLESPALTRARAMIASGPAKRFEDALALIAGVRKVSEKCGYTCQIIEAAVLQAVALERLERADQALEALSAAIFLARRGGWVRPFVESGSALTDLLKRLDETDGSPDFVDMLLGTIQENREPVKANCSPSHDTPQLTPGREFPVEPLTNRELDILEFLAQRLQNKEISEKLFISPNTVRTHLQNLYQKLHVSGRRQAVVKAIDLDILPCR